MSNRIPDDLKAAALTMYREGAAVAAISRELGIGHQTVVKIALAAGELPPLELAAKRREERKQLVKTYREKGFTAEETARVLGVSASTVEKIRRTITPSKIDRDLRIWELHEAHHSRAQIARHMGISHQAVTRVLEKPKPVREGGDQ